MRTWIMIAVLLLVTGCVRADLYPDECFRKVERVFTDTDYIADAEYFPCKRYRESYHWEDRR